MVTKSQQSVKATIEGWRLNPKVSLNTMALMTGLVTEGYKVEIETVHIPGMSQVIVVQLYHKDRFHPIGVGNSDSISTSLLAACVDSGEFQ